MSVTQTAHDFGLFPELNCNDFSQNSRSNISDLKNSERRAAATRVQKAVVVPAGFPRRECMNGTKVFKALYGSPPRSTWARWRKDGTIPAPDKQIGKLSFWWEDRMWRTLTGNTGADPPASA